MASSYPTVAVLPEGGKRILMKGNEALAEAAIIAGCRHYFGYPITPQNEIPTYFARRMPQVGGVFLQAESEPASINMVFGAAASGVRTMTSSSSPGISLMQEGISYLAGARLAAVVVNVMRGGPGLGNIAGAQGDYFQAVKGGGNGDYQCIVLAPSSVQDMAEQTFLAFDLADRYRMVVMMLLDGYLGQMSEPLVMPTQPEGYQRPGKRDYILDGAEDRPGRKVASIHLGEEKLGLEYHVEQLYLSYEEIAKKESLARLINCEGAEVLLCAYGMPARICCDVIDHLKEEGVHAGLFQPQTLWPFPVQQLTKAYQLAKGGRPKQVLVVEMSKGQFTEDIRLHSYGTGLPIDSYGTVGGATPSAKTIIEKVKQYVQS